MTQGEEHVAFFHEIGVAITEWAVVEKSLFLTAASCFFGGDADAGLVVHAFFSIDSFRSKMQFVERLLERRFPETVHLKDWISIRSRLDGLSRRRNHLAHYPRGVWPESEPGRRYALVPWVLQPDKLKQRIARPPRGALCLRDINKLNLEFHAVGVALCNFSERLRDGKEPFPKSSEQAMHPLTIHTLKRQILEALGHPPKPSRRKP